MVTLNRQRLPDVMSDLCVSNARKRYLHLTGEHNSEQELWMLHIVRRHLHDDILPGGETIGYTPKDWIKCRCDKECPTDLV